MAVVRGDGRVNARALAHSVQNINSSRSLRVRSRTVLLLSTCITSCAPGVDDDRAAGNGRSAGIASADSLLLRPENPVWREAAPDSFNVAFQTSRGLFLVEVRRSWAPVGADRFYNLVRHGFFDDSRFYRVVEGFIVQFGLPGDPEVTAVWLERTIEDDPARESNLKGRIAYAMTGPDTRATQVYINLIDNVRLDTAGFAPFGQVIKGMEVVDALYAGYGENAGGGMRRGEQGRIIAEGNAHLDRDFPLLDRIVSARIVPFPWPIFWTIR
jgi:cyclophilin family peptidyl-prolyl cis-trans isomerase